MTYSKTILDRVEGIAYIVTYDDELTAIAHPLNYTLTLGPVRTTRKWRGKKFNLKTSRVIGIEAI